MRTRDARLPGLRALGEIGATLAFLTALFHMPLAEAAAIMQFVPRHRQRWRRRRVLGEVVAGDWAPLGADTLVRLTSAAGFLLMGCHFGGLSKRIGAIGSTQPVRYSPILWAVLRGVVVFGERPDGATPVGTAILMATGIFPRRRSPPVRNPRASPFRMAPRGLKDVGKMRAGTRVDTRLREGGMRSISLDGGPR